MKVVVRKQPARITLSGTIALAVGFGVIWFLPSLQLQVIGIFTLLAALGILFVVGVLAPYLGGVALEEGRIEAVTGFGGVIVIDVDRIDHDRSALTATGLLLVPVSGEVLFLSAMQYSREALLRVADHAGIRCPPSSRTYA